MHSLGSNPSIDDCLRKAVKLGASDVHFSCGKRPKMRLDGDLKDLYEDFIIDIRWMESQMGITMNALQSNEYQREQELDFSHAVKGFGRFRVNFYVQSGSPAAAFRTIPEKVRTVDELGLPMSLIDITDKPNGLILVTGTTGSGKSTTVSAMLEHRNRTYEEHILTIEDPTEFVYQSKKALVNQREIGNDTKSFKEALKRLLRQDPDVILIGELRDPETISIALTAAETGHLVFGTMHTQSASKSVNRIIDSFPSAQQTQIRSQLSDTLQAIISQSLVKKIGGGRIAATEILVRNSAIGNQIREGATAQMYSTIQSGKSYGMHTLDQDLQRLVKDGIVHKEDAMAFLYDKNALDKFR